MGAVPIAVAGVVVPVNKIPTMGRAAAAVAVRELLVTAKYSKFGINLIRPSLAAHRWKQHPD